MTTQPPAEPEPSDQPTADLPTEQPPAEQPVAPANPAAASPAPAAPAAGPAIPPPYASQYPPPYPPPYSPYPFAPQPREPWINPAKRAAVATIALVAAVVLLGAGLIIGAAVSGHSSRGRSVQPGFGPQMHMGRQGSVPGRRPNQLPDRGRQAPRYPGARPVRLSYSVGAADCITQLTRVTSRAAG